MKSFIITWAHLGSARLCSVLSFEFCGKTMDALLLIGHSRIYIYMAPYRNPCLKTALFNLCAGTPAPAYLMPTVALNPSTKNHALSRFAAGFGNLAKFGNTKNSLCAGTPAVISRDLTKLTYSQDIYIFKYNIYV